MQVDHDRVAVHVIVGPQLEAAGLRQDVYAITALVNSAYGYQRVSVEEIRHRVLTARNRALHLAVRASDNKILGVCSSTLHVPWCGPGVGHWGLLAVNPESQGMGVASALVAAAEQRLAQAGLSKVQLEYRYQRGDPQSERLITWYEDKLKYVGPAGRYSGFRMCRKRLEPPFVAADEDSCDGGNEAGIIPGGTLGVFIAWFCAVARWICCGQY